MTATSASDRLAELEVRMRELQVKRLEALHREQCAAYGVLQQQGGALYKLATDVGRTAEGLVVLREKMEQDL